MERSQLVDEQKTGSPCNVFYLPSTCKYVNIDIVNGNMGLKTTQANNKSTEHLQFGVQVLASACSF